MKDLTSSSLDEQTWKLLSFASSEHRINQEYEKYRSESDRMLYGLTDGDELVGCIGIQLIGSSSCEIKHIAVSQSKRGKSFGRQMVENIIKRHGLTYLYAETDNDAVEFYRKLNFVIVSLGEKYPGVERFKCEWDENI